MSLAFHLLLYFHTNSIDVHSRQCMDCSRLEEAILQYSLLRMASWYPAHVTLQLHDALSTTLLCVSTLLQKAIVA